MSSFARNCYTRNGTLITDAAYQPCSNDTSRDSACCGTNHQGAGETQVANDVCESNGLCQNYEVYNGTNAGVKAWWRQGCTDPTWESDYCLKGVCDYAMWQDDNAPVQKCGDNSWCCGEENCCSISSSLFTLAATVGPTATSLSSAIPASTSVSNTMSITSNISISSSTTSPLSTSGSATKGLSTGAKAGIGSGVAVVLILLGIIAILAVKLRKRKPEEEKGLASEPEYTGQEKHQSTAHAFETTPAELHGESVPAEMGERGAAELAGRQKEAELPGQYSD